MNKSKSGYERKIKMKSKQLFLIVPYFFMMIITPFYNMLDRNYFVHIFGCGCVPSTQTNPLHIDFNANNLRAVVYLIILFSMIMLSFFNRKKLVFKRTRIIYVGTVILWNLFLTFHICSIYVWR